MSLPMPFFVMSFRILFLLLSFLVNQ
jgi:hypothetical protein